MTTVKHCSGQGPGRHLSQDDKGSINTGKRAPWAQAFEERQRASVRHHPLPTETAIIQKTETGSGELCRQRNHRTLPAGTGSDAAAWRRAQWSRRKLSASPPPPKDEKKQGLRQTLLPSDKGAKNTPIHQQTDEQTKQGAHTQTTEPWRTPWQQPSPRETLRRVK